MDRVLHRDERGIFDAAVGALYLDTQNATDTTTPLQVTVQNRGTEYLPNVSILLSQNGGYPQKIYLGPLSEHETTSYALYLDNSQLALEPGYVIDAETVLNGQQDSRPENDAKSGASDRFERSVNPTAFDYLRYSILTIQDIGDQRFF